jgi:hypothetical protein
MDRETARMLWHEIGDCPRSTYCNSIACMRRIDLIAATLAAVRAQERARWESLIEKHCDPNRWP